MCRSDHNNQKEQIREGKEGGRERRREGGRERGSWEGTEKLER